MSSAKHQETGDGWKISGYFRDSAEGKYRIQVTHPTGLLKPRQVTALIRGLELCQIALRDRDHPDTIKLRKLEREATLRTQTGAADG